MIAYFEFTVNSSTSETIQINHGSTGSGAAVSTSNSGQTVIQNINLDKFAWLINNIAI